MKHALDTRRERHGKVLGGHNGEGHDVYTHPALPELPVSVVLTGHYVPVVAAPVVVHSAPTRAMHVHIPPYVPMSAEERAWTYGIGKQNRFGK